MAKSPVGVSMRLLGRFSVDVTIGHSVPIAVRLRKSRALLAFLAMKPDYRAQREELATLFWGDTPDIQARHSLRQCLNSLRQDFRLAPDLLYVERGTVCLNPQGLIVDAREFTSRAGSSDLEGAAELYRGDFLADLVLDAEEFDIWRQREADRLKADAAHLLENLAIRHDINGHGDKAAAFAERLVAMDPRREDWQRTSLEIWARYRSRDSAIKRADTFIRLLKRELDVPPSRETRSLIEAIKNGEIAQASTNASEPPPPAIDASVDITVLPASPPPAAAALDSVLPESELEHHERSFAESISLNSSRGRFLAGAGALIVLLMFGLSAVLGPQFLSRSVRSAGLKQIAQRKSESPQAMIGGTSIDGKAVISVLLLPFAADANQDRAFAQNLKNSLGGYLTHYHQLRVVTDQVLAIDSGTPIDIASISAKLGTPYAITGHAGINRETLQVTFQLVDTKSLRCLWSNDIDKPSTEAAMAATTSRAGSHDPSPFKSMLRRRGDKQAVRNSLWTLAI
jgi:DNA-binding SARP family transcriptional activator/TolB-like protein